MFSPTSPQHFVSPDVYTFMRYIRICFIHTYPSLLWATQTGWLERWRASQPRRGSPTAPMSDPAAGRHGSPTMSDPGPAVPTTSVAPSGPRSRPLYRSRDRAYLPPRGLHTLCSRWARATVFFFVYKFVSDYLSKCLFWRIFGRWFKVCQEKSRTLKFGFTKTRISALDNAVNCSVTCDTAPHEKRIPMGRRAALEWQHFPKAWYQRRTGSSRVPMTVA